jgi:site-specific recombinase XerD
MVSLHLEGDVHLQELHVQTEVKMRTAFCFSAASLLLSLGVHPKVLQELLGHTQISMTMDIYSHVLPGLQQDAVGKLNTLLTRPKGGDVGKGG